MTLQARLALGLLTSILGVGLTPGAQAHGSGQGRGQGQGQAAKATSADQSSTTANANVRIEIGARDREIVTSYYTTRAAGLPPGLAKRGGDLPPGLEKQLRKNGQLPPGLEKKLEPLPAALERQLTKLPDGFTRFALGAHLVLMNGKANVVADFLLDVVR